jgi:hypothetical protein
MYPHNLQLRNIPTRASRDPSEGDKYGSVAHAFNVMLEDPEYAPYKTGRLELPPRGIMDPKSVGRSALIFTVLSCQPNALELAISDPGEGKGSFNPETATRFFLSPGTWFRIPPGNGFRLENHSKTYDATLAWTMIKPTVPEAVVQDDNVAESGGDDKVEDGEGGSGSDDDEDEEYDDDDRSSSSSSSTYTNSSISTTCSLSEASFVCRLLIRARKFERKYEKLRQRHRNERRGSPRNPLDDDGRALPQGNERQQTQAEALHD